MTLTLSEILELVGVLDDSTGEASSRKRFRAYLRKKVTDIGLFRDYIQECLRKKGAQYNNALQDLVNHLGHFMGFEVEYGRYRGVKGEIGFDGHWKSPIENFHVVIEVKTTEVYAIKTSTLNGYIADLISEKKIPDWDQTIGLYVIGKPDPEVQQLEDSIIAQKQTNRLRVISAEALLSLAELMYDYDVSHEDILSIIQPSKPTLDNLVDLISSMVAQSRSEERPKGKEIGLIPESEGEIDYWMTPIKSSEERSAEEAIRALVGKEGVYAFGDRTPHRGDIKPGDWICFYASGIGVVAHARITSKPENKPHPAVNMPKRYPWTFSLDNQEIYIDNPIIIDAELRDNLHYFENRAKDSTWGWFVQSTKHLDEHDFLLLTRGDN